MFEPVKRKRLDDEVYEEIRGLIFQGKIAPGEKLPPERELVKRFQVNRGSIREALRRLEEKGLIKVKHGGGAEVLDWKKNGKFELLSELISFNGRLNIEVLRGVLELREILGPELAGYSARRASKAEVAELSEISQKLVENRNDIKKFQELEYKFNQALARASHNLAFKFLVDSISDIYLKYAHLFQKGIATLQKKAKSYPELVKAIKESDEKKARRIMKRLFESSGKEFFRLLDQPRKSKEGKNGAGVKIKRDRKHPGR